MGDFRCGAVRNELRWAGTAEDCCSTLSAVLLGENFGAASCSRVSRRSVGTSSPWVTLLPSKWRPALQPESHSSCCENTTSVPGFRPDQRKKHSHFIPRLNRRWDTCFCAGLRGVHQRFGMEQESPRNLPQLGGLRTKIWLARARS